MEFSGFRPETFQYFADLAKNNSTEWFDENQDTFEEFVAGPMRDLVAALRPALTELDPRLVSEDAEVHLSEMRRGPRTPPGTPPIKTSLYAFFWNQEMRRLADGNLFVGVSEQGVTIGFSIYDFGDPQSRMSRVFRPRLLKNLQLLDDHIKANYLRRGFDFHRYVRAASRLGMREVDAFPTVPSTWESTLGWVARRHIHTESSRLTPGSFVTEVSESFERLFPLYVFASDPTADFKKVLAPPKATKKRAAAPKARKKGSGRAAEANGSRVARSARPR